MNNEVIITCAVTGGHNNFQAHPDYPITPKQIAAAAIEAAKAGAAVAHIHARDPKTGKNSRDPKLFREIVERVRESDTDVVLNLTGGNGGMVTPHPDNPLGGDLNADVAPPLERINHVEALLPEICSLDCGAMNFSEGVYINTPGFLRVMAKHVLDLGIKPELEVFDFGHVRIANLLVEEGLIADPPLYQLCLGIPWGAPADTNAMKAMRDLLPAGAMWAGFGISRMQMPMVAQAVLLGGNVRVGLEDNLYLDKGLFASNGQLVERAAEIITRLGARILSPAEARAKLKLEKRR